ncbi:MAG: PHP domain protein [Clostridiales bacterium 38_11]|nr:MAG: PHP domain protein [Clostridiales bacterium 38_11]HBH12584.1 hypothetical protein [Clostridiales bacterium]
MIDLHIHSELSDGTDPIADIVEIAKENGIQELSLTDHDTVLGIEPITTIATQHDMTVIPAIELTSVSNGHSIHILGYLIDHNSRQLLDFIKITNEYTTKYSLDMISKLNRLGVVDYDASRVEELMSFKDSIYLSDLFKAMIQDGHPYKLKDWPAFYMRTYNRFSYNFPEKFPFTSADAVEIIIEAKGIPVFAHPARLGSEDLKEMDKLLAHGLGGVEVYYPYHDDKLNKRYNDFVTRNHLVGTGGSDWHGDFTTWEAAIGQYGIKDTKLLYQYAEAR